MFVVTCLYGLGATLGAMFGARVLSRHASSATRAWRSSTASALLFSSTISSVVSNSAQRPESLQQGSNLSSALLLACILRILIVRICSYFGGGTRGTLFVPFGTMGNSHSLGTTHIRPMFDCHAHLTDPSLQESLDKYLAEAEAAGVFGIVTVSESLEDAKQVIELSGRINNDSRRTIRIHPAIGMHPEKADLEALDEMLNLIDEHADSIVCVGEVGLDYSRHLIGEAGGERAERAKAVQREVFARQARRAEEYGLAVNVHSRAAGHHAITLLRDEGITRVVLHAFDGKTKYAVEAAKAGYYFSVPPIVCRSDGFQKLVKALPLESLLLETDSPALAPMKNEVNEPKNISVACQWIADLKNVPLEAVIEATTANARVLFPRAFTR